MMEGSDGSSYPASRQLRIQAEWQPPCDSSEQLPMTRLLKRREKNGGRLDGVSAEHGHELSPGWQKQKVK